MKGNRGKVIQEWGTEGCLAMGPFWEGLAEDKLPNTRQFSSSNLGELGVFFQDFWNVLKPG